MGFAAILGKTAKFHPKVVTRKNSSPYHKRYEPRAFAWMQTEALLPFWDKGWGSKHNESIFHTPIFEGYYLWEKVRISAILVCTYHGSLWTKNMSKIFWSRPIVGAFKYAHYG